MQIKDMFRKKIDREIQGVIIVGQGEETNVAQELEEYVVTRELQRHFADFFAAYKKGIQGTTPKMGVWISGFFGSGKSHVLSNFANIVNLNYDMGTLYIQNPPRRVLESLKAGLDGDIEYYGSQYPELDRGALTNIYKALNSDVYGQDECKKQILSGMYRLTTGATNKPVVLMLYGPSGVGKTESAKSISKSLGGELLRIQFSMMQHQKHMITFLVQSIPKAVLLAI